MLASSYTSLYVTNTFANHDPLRIQTKVHVGQGTGSTTVSDDFDEVPFDSAAFDRIATSGVTGIYSLDRTVTNVNNFLVTVDGQRLHPRDYTVSGTNLIMSNNAKASIIGSYSCSNNTYKRKSHHNQAQDLEYSRI